MDIYTKTGDKGFTSLLTGERISKASPRVEAYGTVDEINSALGIAKATVLKPEVKKVICSLQKMLILLMAQLASRDKNNNEPSYITIEHVQNLESLIDEFSSKLKPIKSFISPGDNLGSAALDLARTVTRRAERQVIRLNETKNEINIEKEDYVLIVLNRLSDLCFVLSRVEAE
ncbi:cob(I)yrinic acid a,c-diamide adenosyltransferase [Selenomonadales bacterium OttesenSCG-928-I06]|nr:cob(I)yrinic acid a,c-diamide adenosyltransferase [Selenomonadales bacterium OttesenSCG-928-I06]